MGGAGYWSSWAGRWQHQAGNRLRAQYLSIDGEPVQKRQRVAHRRELEIREFVAAELRRTGRSAFRGGLALSVHFTLAQPQPPDLLKLTKFLLDALGSGKDPGAPRPALFGDDRQVRMLHASWSRARPGEVPSTVILARPIRDVMHGLLMRHDLHLHIREGEFDTGPYFLEEIPDDPDPTSRDHLPLDLQRRLESFERSWLNRVLLQRWGAHFRTMLTASAGRLLDAAATHRTDIPATVLGDFDRRHNEWIMLENGPGVALPPMPVRAGDGGAFTDQLRHRLHERRPALGRLATEEFVLGVRIVMVPPAFQAMDLDNLGNQVVRAVHEEFRPHQQLLDAIGSYQVVRLRREEDDPPGGRLWVVIGDAQIGWSDWDDIISDLDNFD